MPAIAPSSELSQKVGKETNQNVVYDAFSIPLIHINSTTLFVIDANNLEFDSDTVHIIIIVPRQYHFQER